MWKVTVLLFLTLTLLGACGGGQAPETGSSGDASAQTGAGTTQAGSTSVGEAPTPTPGTSPSLGLKLFPSPPAQVETGGLGTDRPRLLDYDETPRNVYLIDLGQSGSWAALVDLGGRTEVKLFLPRVTESAQAHIHSGECGGAAEHELPDVVVGASAAELDVPTDDLLTGGSWIDIHSSSNVEVACIAIPGADRLVTFQVNEANESGVSGWATIYEDEDKSRVVVYLNPGESEPRPLQLREMTCAPELLDAEDMGASLGERRHNLGFLIEGLSRSKLGVAFDDMLVGDLAIIPGTPTGRITALACGEVPSP